MKTNNLKANINQKLNQRIILFREVLGRKLGRKGDMTEWELVTLLVGLAILAFIFIVVIKGGSDESCKGIAKIFGKC